ncbi:MAG: GyrI-like domain-containing protein [bacterium]
MTPRIERIAEKKLIGKRMKMSFADDKTYELFSGFMPNKKNIKNTVSTELFCLNVFQEKFEFNESISFKEFEKWAAVEVMDFNTIPDGMEPYVLKGGLYAVFIYKGLPQDFSSTAMFIYGNWIPNSEYELDDREHFYLMGDKYKNNDPSSEEEVWIPIKRRK